MFDEQGETNIVQEIRLKAAKLGKILWRNNRGSLQDKKGRWVNFGIGDDGGSDLIGGTPVTITASMVGKQLLVFTAYEVKTPEGMKPKGKKAIEHFNEQQNFIERIVGLGGIGKMLCSPDEL